MNSITSNISLHIKKFFHFIDIFHNNVAQSSQISGSLQGKPSLAVQNRRVHAVAATVQAQSFCTVQSSSRCNSFTIKRLVKPSAGVPGRLFTVLLALSRALNRGKTHARIWYRHTGQLAQLLAIFCECACAKQAAEAAAALLPD